MLLANMVAQLEMRWQTFYLPLFSRELELGAGVAGLRQYLSKARLTQGIVTLERTWLPGEAGALRRAAICAYVSACAEIGIYSSAALYHEVLGGLVLSEPFLPTVVCAHSVKRLTERAAIDVREITREQYKVMKLLDTFYTGPDEAWG
jgi:hypothetical protein